MDPKACVQRWLDAYEDRDWSEFKDAAADYNGWVGRGGFPAKGTLADAHCIIWGLSGETHNGEAMSPVQIDGVDKNTCVPPSVISDILG